MEISANDYSNVVDMTRHKALNISDYVKDDTLLRFGAGDYKIESFTVRNLNNFAILCDDNAQFEAPHNTTWRFGRKYEEGADSTGNIVISGLDVDNDGDFHLYMYLRQGENYVGGFRLRNPCGTGMAFIPQLVGKNTNLTCENWDLTAGGAGIGMWYSPPYDGEFPGDGKTGSDEYEIAWECWQLVEQGDLTLRNVNLNHWSQEGAYLSPHRGNTYVYGGSYGNSDISCLRTCGPAVIDGVEIKLDDKSKREEYSARSRNYNTRGIWHKEGNGKCVIKNTTVHMKRGHEAAGSSTLGGIIIGAESADAHIENVRIHFDEGGIPLDLRRKSWPFRTAATMCEGPESRNVTIKNLVVTGDKSGPAFRTWGRDVDLNGLYTSQTDRIEINGGARVDAQNVNYDSKIVPSVGHDGEMRNDPEPEPEPEPMDIAEIVNIDGENLISFTATGVYAEYDVKYDGNALPGPNANVSNEDSVGDGHMVGAVAGTGTDDYNYTGKITGGFVAPSIGVRVNDERVEFVDLVEFYRALPDPEPPEEEPEEPPTDDAETYELTKEQREKLLLGYGTLSQLSGEQIDALIEFGEILAETFDLPDEPDAGTGVGYGYAGYGDGSMGGEE